MASLVPCLARGRWSFGRHEVELQVLGSYFLAGTRLVSQSMHNLTVTSERERGRVVRESYERVRCVRWCHAMVFYAKDLCMWGRVNVCGCVEGVHVQPTNL